MWAREQGLNRFLLQVEGNPFMVVDFAEFWFGEPMGRQRWPQDPGELRRKDPDLGSLGCGL